MDLALKLTENMTTSPLILASSCIGKVSCQPEYWSLRKRNYFHSTLGRYHFLSNSFYVQTMWSWDKEVRSLVPRLLPCRGGAWVQARGTYICAVCEPMNKTIWWSLYLQWCTYTNLLHKWRKHAPFSWPLKFILLETHAPRYLHS